MYKSWMWKQRSYREQFEAGEAGGGGGTGEAHEDEDTTQAGSADGDDTQAGGDDDHQNDDPNNAASEDDQVVVMLGDEALPSSNDDEIEGKPAPQWVKDLRKSDREKSRRIRELEQAAAAREAAAPAVEAVGEKPTLESCDFDAEVYAEKVLAWSDRKRKADDAAAAARQEQEAAAAEWQKRINTYNTNKAALRVDDFDGAEHVVRESLSQTQQGVILQGADKPELVVYALGRNPAKAKELAAIKDPVKFAFAVAKLETQLKVAPRGKVPPAPEREVRGTAAGAVGVDNQLARLQAEAEKTGDRTKVAAYLREQRRKAA